MPTVMCATKRRMTGVGRQTSPLLLATVLERGVSVHHCFFVSLNSGFSWKSWWISLKECPKLSLPPCGRTRIFSGEQRPVCPLQCSLRLSQTASFVFCFMCTCTVRTKDALFPIPWKGYVWVCPQLVSVWLHIRKWFLDTHVWVFKWFPWSAHPPA